MKIKKTLIIYVLFLLALTFVGCKKEQVLEEDISVQDTVVSFQDPDSTIKPVIEDKVDDKEVNWNQINIPLSDFWGKDWGATFVHNSKYYFYLSDNRIIRLNKKNNAQKEIHNFKGKRNSKIILYLTNKQLYYINQATNDIYSVNLNGHEKKRILNNEVLKKFHSVMKNPKILGMHINNGEIYVMLSSYEVVHYDMKQKKLDNLAYDVRKGIFFNNSLYYMKRSPSPIYVTGLKANTEKIWKKSKQYRDLYKYKNSFYNVIDEKIFKYSINKKKSLYYELTNGQEFIEIVPSEDMFSFIYWEKDNLYLLWKKRTEQNWNNIKLPEDYYAAYGIVDGVLFYEAVDLKNEEDVLPFYKIMYIIE